MTRCIAFVVRWMSMVTLVTVVGCGPSTLIEYRHEGQAITRRLIAAMMRIDSREDLIAAQGHLSALFEELVDMMIASREYQEKSQAEVPELSDRDRALSERLRNEMDRLYALEGGRELMEQAQRDALKRLDTFEYQLSRRQMP